LNEIIQINYESENPTVSARDLHEGLEIKSKYADWFKNMSAYGFTDGVDYFTVSKNLENGGRTIEHELSVDMAKQICMIQRTEKGRTYRQYFLDLEKAWNTPEQVFARALKMANQKIDELKADKSILIEDVQRMKPKEIFADAVSASHTSILVRELAKLISQNGIDTGEKRLYKWLRDKGYLIKKKGDDWNQPTQLSIKRGLFELKETVFINGKGKSTSSTTTKVTGKGQQYFINKFLVDKQEVM
jgi:anti-repressor protein